MEFIKFDTFFYEYGIQAIDTNHLRFKVTRDMIISGETRLSYLTIMKITEAFRDYYWSVISNGTCDSICKQIDSHFFSPFFVGEIIDCYLNVINVSSKSFYISFNYFSGTDRKSIVNMQNISFDPLSNQSIVLPADIVNHLTISMG